MFYKPKFFITQELVPPDIFNTYGEDYSLMFLDPRLLKTIDQIRKHFNESMHINNWYWSGRNTQRGFRRPYSSVGAELSQHKFGRAADFDIAGMEAEDVRKEIINKQHLFPEITTMEDDVSWVHIDIRARKEKEIYLFKP